MVTDTDGTPGVKTRRISQLSFRQAFSVVVVAGEDTVETKPNVHPFKLAASRLGVSCAECAFIGDKPFTDIWGAREAGMKTILIRRGMWGPEKQPDFSINSLSELNQFL
jgi:putative hydrolase of the HAD superfamily